MTRALVDTSLFVATEQDRPLRGPVPTEAAVSVITIGELRAGVLVATDVDVRSRRLATLRRAETLDPVPVDDEVAHAWAGLRVALRELGRRMPVNDSWIAATAVHLGIPVATQDDDYDDVPGLEVIRL